MPYGDDVAVGAGDPVVGGTLPTVHQAKDIGDAIIAGLQSSSMGLALRGKLPSMQLGEDAPWYQRAAAGAGGIVGDAPLIVGGAMAGAAAGSAVPVIGTAVGGGAGALAVPMAVRQGLIAAYENNHASSWQGVWDIAKAALVGGAKGAAIGGATMGAGRIVTPLVAPLAGRAVLAGDMSAQAARYAVDTTAFGTELATMTTAAAGLEGHLPTAKDFMDNAILLGGVKGAVAIAKGMRSTYAETGRTPDQIAADVQKRPEIVLDLKPVEAPSSKNVVTAYHGSPYSFEKFDASKIGTGEGAQAYGHGLYFAEEPAVATEYSRIRGTTISQQQLDAYYAPGRKIAPYGTTERIDTVQSYDNKTGEVTVLRTENGKTQRLTYGDTGADKLKVVADVGGEEQSLYKVEIPQHVVDGMLDWEKPLNQQTPAVQTALKKAGLWPGDGAAALLTGGKFYNDLAMYRKLDEGFGKQASSEALAKAGITGNKYLDQGSRISGTGTRNFVVFDHNNVRIVERNGETVNSPTVNNGRTPSAYAPLALEERIKAAIDADPKPEAMRKMLMNDGSPTKLGEPPINDPVKPEYITDQDTLKGVIRAVEQLYEPEIQAQTRGQVTNKATAAAALESIASGDAVEHAIGSAENARQLYARAHVLKAVLQEAYTNMAKLQGVPEAELTPSMKLAALASNEKVSMVYSEFRGARAEAGRALQIFQALKRDNSVIGDAETLIKLAERKGPLQNINLDSLKDTTQLAKFIEGYNAATTTEKVLEAWKAAILTGPQTHLANIMGNLMKWVVETPENVIAAAISAGKRAIAGDPMTMAEWKARAFAPVYGLQFGAKDAVTIAGEVWRQEGMHLEKIDVQRGAIPGKLGEFVRLPFKALQSEDALFRTVAERAEAHIMAVDRVVKEGFNPDTLEGKGKIAEYTNDPTAGLEEEAGLAATKRVQQAGAEGVFSERLGPRLEQVQRAMVGHWSQFVIPFFRTPANLVSWAVQHVPGLNLLSGRWRDDYAAGGDRQARALSRVIVGAGLTLTAYEMASNGSLTGGGLFNKEESGSRIAAGWQPYSLKIGDKYYSYQRIEPLAKVLGIAADTFDMMQQSDKEEDKMKMVGMAVLMFGNATISTTYLSGLANVVQSLSDPTRYGENFLEQYASSLVPKAIGQAVTAVDPYKREVNGIGDAIQSQLPFIREKLMPKRDVWGEPVRNDKWFDIMPVQVSEASQNKVATEAMRLHLAIADAPKFVMERAPFAAKEKRTELEPEQRDILREVRGKNAMAILAPIVNAEDWKQIPDFAKAEIYRKVLEGTTKQGVYAALPPDAAARQKLRDQLVGKILQQVQDAEGK